MTIYSICGHAPPIAGTAWVAPQATLIGRVELAECSLILGAPAKVVRELSDEEVTRLNESAADYARRAELYRGELRHVG